VSGVLTEESSVLLSAFTAKAFSKPEEGLSMKIRPVLFVLWFAFAFVTFNEWSALNVFAQQKQQTRAACPVTKASSPDMVYVNDKLQFVADVRGGDSTVKPTYNWTVSAGTILAGQGTSVIDVTTEGLSDGQSVTATVEVGGFARECAYGQIASSSTTSVMKRPEARKLDEFGSLTPKEQADRLDNFAIELQMDPLSRGYIIAYGGRASRAGGAQKTAARLAAARLKDYLVKKRALDAGRIVTVDGGYRDRPAFELWLVPTGAQLPAPTPTIKR